jgi:hypothetical protein
VLRVTADSNIYISPLNVGCIQERLVIWLAMVLTALDYGMLA